MSNKSGFEKRESWQGAGSEATGRKQQGIEPGKVTRTSKLGPPQAKRSAPQPPAPVQRKPDPAAEAARREQEERTARWLDIAIRPDLHGAPVQMRGGSGQSAGDVHELAAEGLSGAAATLPYLDQIQRSFGHHDVSGTKAHIGGPAVQASQAMGARAYATGDHVAFQGTPDLHTAAHEAAHAVQQRAGVALEGGVGAVGDPYEHHADAVADRVVRGESAESLLDERAASSTVPATQRAVQRSPVTYGSRVVAGTAEENTHQFWMTVLFDYSFSGNPRQTLQHYQGLLAAFQELPKPTQWDIGIIKELEGAVHRAQLEVDQANQQQQSSPTNALGPSSDEMVTEEEKEEASVSNDKDQKSASGLLGPVLSSNQPSSQQQQSQSSSGSSVESVVLQALTLSVGRLDRVIKRLAPVLEKNDLEGASRAVATVCNREGPDFMAAFYKNICGLHAELGAQLSGKASFIDPRPEVRDPLGATANTDRRSGKIALFQGFFERDALPQSDTLTHETVHKLLGVDDQAYKGTRIFKYLKPAFRLQNPDSYVELLRELDDAEPSGKDPGFSVQGGVQVQAAQVERDVALAQHVAQRGCYLLNACASELANGIPVFMQQSQHVQAYLKWVRGNTNEGIRNKKDDAKTLSDWARTFSRLANVVALALTRAVKVVAVTDVKNDGKLALESDEWQVTLFSGANDRKAWIFVKLLQALNKTEGAISAWHSANAVVNEIEPYDAKFADV